MTGGTDLIFVWRQHVVDATDELVEMLEVLGHLCRQNHVHDLFPQQPVILSVKTGALNHYQSISIKENSVFLVKIYIMTVTTYRRLIYD